MPHHTSWSFTLILPTHLRLCLPSGLFPSGFPTKILSRTLLFPIRATCPAHFILLDWITWKILGEVYRSLSSSLCSFLLSRVTSSLFGPNILLGTLFLNTLSKFVDIYKYRTPEKKSSRLGCYKKRTLQAQMKISFVIRRWKKKFLMGTTEIEFSLVAGISRSIVYISECSFNISGCMI